MDERFKCKRFLVNNGFKEKPFKEDTREGWQFRYSKQGMPDIEVETDEIVFISDVGDWLHIPLNLFALIGALMHYRMIATDYKNWEK